MNELARCPSTLAKGFKTYSPSAKKHLWGGKKVSHVLPYDAPTISEKSKELLMENRTLISISGVQTKAGIIQKANKLRLTKEGEQSTHILKPAVPELLNGTQTCANEHLTMQLASQVFGIQTAANGLCFFQTGEAAYITRRFDVLDDGTKSRVEDFASIALKSPENDPDYKYEYSYEEMAELVREFLPAWRVEIEKFFRLVLFNYLVSNGDAHLKNFSAIQTPSGDYVLAPAYDLMNTSLHVKDKIFALKKGLFKDRKHSFVNGKIFAEFGVKIGCLPKRVDEIIGSFLSNTTESKAEELIRASFLSEEMKLKYMAGLGERLFFMRD